MAGAHLQKAYLYAEPVSDSRQLRRGLCVHSCILIFTARVRKLANVPPKCLDAVHVQQALLIGWRG